MDKIAQNRRESARDAALASLKVIMKRLAVESEPELWLVIVDSKDGRVSSIPQVFELGTQVEVLDDPWEFYAEMTRLFRCNKRISGYSTFFGPPLRNGAVFICLVVGVHEAVLRRVPHVTSKVRRGREALSTSLLDLVIREFVRVAELIFQSPDTYVTVREAAIDPDSILRRAGTAFLATDIHVLMGYLPLPSKIDPTFELFSFCNEVSAMPYEQKQGAGKIVLRSKNHPAIDERVLFDPPIKISAERTVRKLLEMCRHDLWLIYQDRKAVGLGTYNHGRVKPNDNSVFEIQFVGHYKWQFWHRSTLLMNVDYGLPSLPAPKVQNHDIIRRLAHVFPRISDADATRVADIVRKLTENDMVRRWCIRMRLGMR